MKDLINQVEVLKDNTNNLIINQDLNYDHLRNISNRLSHMLSALKNMESSSRIIHSQPQHNAYYWIRTKDSSQYEVGRGRFIGGVGYIISESREVFLPSMLADWISTPLSPKG